LKRVERDVQHSLKTGELVSEWRVIWPDGSTHWLHAQARVFLDAHGQPERMIGVNFDLTERKRAEEQLRDADRRKDEFLATLAHELRNPLAPIRNALEILERSPDPEYTRHAHALMGRQLEQMVRLVDDLLDVSRITRGKLELRRERIKLGTIVNSAIETSRPTIDHMGHALTVNLPKQPIIVDADFTRLAQVLSNLLNNSAKYTDRGGQIWLHVEQQGREVVLSVSDNGIGIAADQLSHIFEIFSQVDGSTDRSQGGLGIGLTLVKRLVEMHGGKIEAQSDGIGKGARFIVRLPIVVDEPAAQPTSGNGQEVLPKSSHRILIVDDNRDAADTLAMLLKFMGNEMRTAYDGQEGVDAAAEFRPAVVLLDIGLPKMNGIEACRHIRSQAWGKNVVLIAVTGWGQDEDRCLTHEAGFDHHMVKPVNPKELMKLLASVKHVAS
jgi:signal transduction histidine kinase/CheY-like chemotaxis protein